MKNNEYQTLMEMTSLNATKKPQYSRLRLSVPKSGMLRHTPK